MLTLYHSPLMPTCRKIRLMLREKALLGQLPGVRKASW